MNRRNKNVLRRVGLSSALVIGIISCNNRLERESQDDVAIPADANPARVECAPLHKNKWRNANDAITSQDMAIVANVLGTSFESVATGALGEVICNQAVTLDGNIVESPVLVSVVGAAAEACLVGEPPESASPTQAETVFAVCPSVPN